MLKLVSVFLVFVQLGLMCFGGGNVLVPVYIAELVNGRGWMTLEDFGNLMAISQMTPGPISVNAATFFGYRYAGLWGGFVATVGLVTPSFVLMTIALHSLERWKHSAVVRGLMWGVAPATIALMAVALVEFLKMSVFADAAFHPAAVVICATATLTLCKTKLSIMAMIFISAILGALIFPLM